MAGTTCGEMRQQWLGLAKFIFFAECCSPENIQHYNENLSEEEDELYYDDQKIERAWELTKQIFNTVEELICMDPKDWMNDFPAFSASSIGLMLKGIEGHPGLTPSNIQRAFWGILSAVVEIYDKPKYYQVPRDEIGDSFNKIKDGLGYDVSVTNGFGTALSGGSVEDYDDDNHMEYALALFHDAVSDPEFEWEVHDTTLFGRDELCVFLQRALVTLLITVHVAAEPKKIIWAFHEVKDYCNFLIPAVKWDLRDMLRSYHVKVDYPQAAIPNIDMGYLSDQPFGMAMEVVPVTHVLS